MRFVWNLCAIGAAGFAGAVLRWLISLAMNNRGPVPWGTLLINVAGSFILGWFMAVANKRLVLSEALFLAIATGFVGAFTTFSTLMFETNSKLEDGSTWLGFGYLAGSIVLGLAAVKLGVMLGQPR